MLRLNGLVGRLVTCARFAASAVASWALAFGVACGSESEPVQSPEPDAAPPERLPENDARTDPDAPCTTGIPAATAFCAMPLEETGLEFVGQSSTTKDGCTQLYVASRASGDDDARVRRYKMTGVAVCGFARDEAFGEPRAKLSAISASEDGTVFGLGYRVVRRLAPGPVVDCVAHDVTLGDRALLAVAPGGRTGYVGWNDDRFHVARLNASAEGCEVTPFLGAGVISLPRAAAITVDTRGRLHVLELTNNVPLKRVSILDERGWVAGTYDTLEGADFMGWDVTLTSCGAGTCVVGFGAVASFDVEGKLLARQGEEMAADSFLGRGFVGSIGGPLFRIGIGWQPRPGLRIQTIKVP